MERGGSRRALVALVTAAVVVSLFAPLGAGSVAGGVPAAGTAADSGTVENVTSDQRNAVAIDPALETAAADAAEVEVVVRLEEVDRAALARSDDEVSTLKAHADAAQDPVERFAASHAGVELEGQYWITNAVVLTVDTERVSLERIGGIDGVTAIHGNFAVEMMGSAAGPVSDNTNTTESVSPSASATEEGTASSYDTTYGLAQINATDVWANYETRGEGVKVAVLDTGVDPDHPDIDISSGNWADFVDGRSTPYDDQGHGTHVSGTVAGGDASGEHIGVAPDTTLMHAKVLDEYGGGYLSDILDAMQWAVDNDADVISMSLGAGGYHEPFVDPVRNAQAQGTLVVSSSGNDGPGTSGSPGNVYDGLAIGASNQSEGIAWFSSGEDVNTSDWNWSDGPPDNWPETYVVPDVAAPGVSVKSSVPGGGYSYYNGTSMAAPHVSGTVALVESSTVRDLQPDEIKYVLRKTAWKPAGEDETTKDTRYGDGIIDAHAAVEKLDGTVAGSVTDNVTGRSLENVTVRIEREDGEWIYETRTDADGTYAIDGIIAEWNYTVTVGPDGYDPDNRTVYVPTKETTTVDFSLSGDATLEVTAEGAHFGERLENASVDAVRDGAVYPGYHDGNGTYVVENVPSGDREYDVVASRDGYRTNETNATVATDGTTDAGLVTLEGNATLAVTVEDRVAGTPVENATLSVERENATGTYEPAGRTGAGGGLEVAVPGVGDAFAVATDPGGYERGSKATDSIASGDRDAVTVRVSGDASIDGTVTDQLSGDGIENATVTAEYENRSYEAVTDGDGTYSIGAVPGTGDRYTVTAVRESYHANATEVGLESGANATVDLALAPVGNATVNGTVTDDRTRGGIDGAPVSITHADSGLHYEATTDGDGSYAADGIVGGYNYTVTVAADGYEPGSATRNVPENSTVTAEFVVAGSESISGTVVDGVATGQPGLENATLTIDYRDGGEFTVSGATNETGDFTVADVPGNATHDVTATVDRYDPATVSDVEVGSASVDVGAIGLSGRASISGTVFDHAADEPIENATVTARGDGRTYDVSTSETGGYEIDVPGNATYDVRTTAEGYDDANDTQTVADAEAVTADVPLTGSATLRGTVTDAAIDEPIDGATIVATGDVTYAVATDETGNYSTPIAANATYRVRSDVTGYHDASRNETAAPDETITLNLSLSGNAAVNATVRDVVTGDPVENATLVARNGSRAYDATTGPDGTATVENVPGTGDEYRITTTALGYDDENLTRTISDPIDANVSLAGNASISGQVFDATDPEAPLERTAIAARVDGGRYGATVGENGTYVIEDVPGTGDRYNVTATARAYGNTVETTPVTDDVTGHDIGLERRAHYIGVESVDAPEEVTVGTAFEIDATVRNLGTEQWTDSVAFVVDGTTIATEAETLPPGNETVLTATHTVDETGTVSYRAATANESLNGTIEVRSDEGGGAFPGFPEPGDSGASIAHSELSATELEVGEPLFVSVVIENGGSETDPQFVQLAAGGEFVAQEVVPVDAGDRVVAEYVHTFDEPGTYDIRLNDERIGTVEVTGPASATPDDETEEPADGDGEPTGTPDGDALGVPGFGVPVALLALLVTVGARIVRR